MRTSKIIKNLKNFGRLRMEDKKWLAENKLALFEFVKNNPVRKATLVRHSILEKPFLQLILKPMPIIVGLLIAALLGGGGVAYASQGSLPGDTLYPVKLMTEEAQTAFVWKPEKKVELRAKFANRRLEEIQKLQKRLKKKNGKISPEIVKKAMERAEQRLKKAEEEIVKMEEGALKDKALEAASRLEEALETHQQILSDLAGEVPDEAEEVLLHAQEDAAKHAVRVLGRILKLEKAKEAGKKIREKIKEGKVPRIRGAEERVDRKLRALKNRLAALENFIENLKDRENIEISEEVETKLDEAEEKVNEVEALLEEEKYLEAFGAANAAMRLMMETKLLLRPGLRMPIPVSNDDNDSELEEPVELNESAPVPVE